MPQPEIYVSIDIEADGPIPSANSMLSIGAAAFRRGSTSPISTFEANLEPLPGAGQDPDTMAWWSRFPEAWTHVTTGAVPAEGGMTSFKRWANDLPGKKVMVVYPTWDFMWVHWYLCRFTGDGKPFGIGALDIKSMLFAGGAISRDFKGVSKRRMPKHYFEGAPPHTHKALDDAIGQGVLFVNALADVQGQ